MNYEILSDIVAKRRSIRKFEDTPVSREDIEKIVQIGMQAPSGFNAQMWDVVVVDDVKLRDEISGYILDGIGKAKTSKGFKTAPVFILFYADERTRAYGPAAKKEDDNWWEFTRTVSLSASFMSMQIAAASLGLGTMWVSAFRNPEVDSRAKTLLSIPSHFKVFEMMALGHPAIKPGNKKLRQLSDTIHYNKSDNYRTQEDLDKWF